jgi:hypothetical protein
MILGVWFLVTPVAILLLDWMGDTHPENVLWMGKMTSRRLGSTYWLPDAERGGGQNLLWTTSVRKEKESGATSH